MKAGRRPITPLLIVAIYCAFSGELSAQSLPRDIAFERVTIPGTIRSSQVTNIVQDSLGLLWIAGHGLYRYDGFKFKLYTGISDQEIFSPQDILSLFYDSHSNRILVGTRRYGIVAYDYRNDQLASLPSINKAPVLNQLAQTSDGKVWAASYNSGLFFLENDTLKKLPDPRKQFIHPATIIGNGSDLLVGGIGRIIVLANGKIKDEIKLLSSGYLLPAYTVATSLFVDRGQNLWIGTEKQGVLVYNLSDRKFIRHFAPSSSPFYSKISKIHQDRSGLVWILTKAAGLVIYSPREDRTVHLSRDPFSPKSLASDNCFSLAEDKQGIVWIGGTGDINKYDRNQIKFRHIFHNPLEKLSLTDNMVRGVLEDRNGNLWVGTDGGYINILNLEKETTEYVKVKLKNDSINYVPLYFAELNDRITLIGSSMGLLQIDRETKAITPYRPLWSITQKRNIRQLVVKGEKLFFIFNGFLYVHNLRTGKTDFIRTAGSSEATNLTAMCLDTEKNLWVGGNNGISLYDDGKNEFTFYRFPKPPASSDESLLMVLSVERIDDKIYVGTFNNGLWELDIPNRSSASAIVNYVDRPGLASNTIYATLPDDQGNIWLSTNSGLVQFDPRSKQFVSFSLTEGLQEEEFNRLAYAKTKNGNIVFGGINGINVFHPRDVSVAKEDFKTKILSVTANDPVSAKPDIKRITDFKNELKFDYNQNSIAIHFFVAHYKQPRRYTLFYKLDNFEKDWKEVINENVATYSNLQPGNYTFLLKTVGINREENTISLPIALQEPYWKTWWFIAIAFLVVSFLVMTIIRSYVRKSQFDRQRLEALLKMRTSEIEKSKEELQVLNQKKDLIFSILSHDLRSPLTTLKGFLGYIIDHAHELTLEDLKKHAVNIKTSVTNSLDLIDNTLFWSLSQMGNIQYTPTNFSLQQLIDKLRGLYQLTADKKRIPLTITCDEEIMIHGDENMIYVTLRNLVSNALKFTTEGNPVMITCERKYDYAEINVVDRGIGMSEEYLRRIQSMDQPMLKKGTSNEKGTGLGLLLCKKFIELNKGELLISSIENKGTTFTVILPLAVHQPSEVPA